MMEHKYAVSKQDERSVVAMHCKEKGHSFDFDNPKVLDRKASKFKREFSEILHIQTSKHSINRKTDTKKLSHIYKKSISVIQKIKHQSLPPPL